MISIIINNVRIIFTTFVRVNTQSRYIIISLASYIFLLVNILYFVTDSSFDSTTNHNSIKLIDLIDGDTENETDETHEEECFNTISEYSYQLSYCFKKSTIISYLHSNWESLPIRIMIPPPDQFL